MKVTIEKQDGERIEIESDKIRVAWHNKGGYEGYDPADDPEWFYDEWVEASYGYK